MRSIGSSFIVASMLLLALPLGAQQESVMVTRVVVVKPKAGMQQQFEEALKRHLQWHRQNDPWTYWGWQIITGDRTGQYVVGTFGHRWEDFDTHAKFDPADQADANANVAQYLESANFSLLAFHPEISRLPDEEVPSPLVEVITYLVNGDSESEFNYTLRKIHEAIGKTKWVPYYAWYELANGGEHPTYILVIPHNTWAEFQPPKKTFPAMLEEAYGREEADSLVKSLNRTVRSVRSEVGRFRTDLSAQPKGR